MRTAKIGPDLRSVASLQLEFFESRVKSSTASTYAAIIFFLTHIISSLSLLVKNLIRF